MVADTKEGESVVPVCIQCRWADEDIPPDCPPHCHSPKLKGNFDIVYGWRAASVLCRDARKDPDGCYVPGNFYEPKLIEPPEPPEPPPKRIIKLLSPIQQYWNKIRRK